MLPTLPSDNGPVKGAHGPAPDGASRHRAAWGSAKAADPRALSSLGRGGRQPSCPAPGPMAGRNVRCWSVCPLTGPLSVASMADSRAGALEPDPGDSVHADYRAASL